MSTARRVVVTGIGPITAAGTGKEPLWESALKGKTHRILHRHMVGGELWAEYYLAAVPDFDPEWFRLPRGALESIRSEGLDRDIDLLYLIGSIQLALRDSGLSFDPEGNRIGVVLTHENPGADRFVQEVFDTAGRLAAGEIERETIDSPKRLADWLYRRHSRTVYNMQSFMYLHHVSKVFQFHGPSLFLNNACASGLYAIEAAAERIRSGRCPAAVVAGSDHPLFATKYLWFRDMGLYAEDGVMQPFDRDRHGFIFGDGGGALVLEEMDRAGKRGAPVYAEYLGGGFNQEAWKVSLPMVSGDFYARAFRDAFRAAGVQPEEVDLVVPHGVATGIGDRFEARTFEKVFSSGSRRPVYTAFKPLLGHNLGGSALLETILLLLSLQKGCVPATLEYRHPDPDLPIRMVSETLQRSLSLVAKSSNGFGGYNAVALFRKVG